MQPKRYRDNNDTTKPLQVKKGNILNSSGVKKRKSIVITTTSNSPKHAVSKQGKKLEFFDKSNTFEQSTNMPLRSHKNYRTKPKTREQVKNLVKVIPDVSNKNLNDRSLKFEDFDQPPDSTSTPVINHIRDNIDSHNEGNRSDNIGRYNYILHGQILNEAPEPFKNWQINGLNGAETNNNARQEYCHAVINHKSSQLVFKDRQVLNASQNITPTLKEHDITTDNPHHFYKRTAVFCTSNNISSSDNSCNSELTGYHSSGGNATYNNSDG
ncbi:hypothetical protein C6P45_003247 [Maudiozyma exigua]|uniref:Uncharacterized protein n=1 Tax=Maudiozyma exigua TaxID=34358 RepID=A0A9P6WE51_MAUEX|nr:hypothetical protein C6P45_003247 [Kazachstania exigua]